MTSMREAGREAGGRLAGVWRGKEAGEGSRADAELRPAAAMGVAGP